MAGRKDRRARLEATRRFFTAILERDESQILLHFPLAGQTRTHSLSLSLSVLLCDGRNRCSHIDEGSSNEKKRETLLMEILFNILQPRRILFTRFITLSNSRPRLVVSHNVGKWKSWFSKCRSRNRYVSAHCTFFHSWNKVVRGREMVPLIGELFSSIRRQ